MKWRARPTACKRSNWRFKHRGRLGELSQITDPEGARNNPEIRQRLELRRPSLIGIYRCGWCPSKSKKPHACVGLFFWASRQHLVTMRVGAHVWCGGARLFDVHQFQLIDQGFVWANFAHALLAVRKLWRHNHFPFRAFLHQCDGFLQPRA